MLRSGSWNPNSPASSKADYVVRVRTGALSLLAVLLSAVPASAQSTRGVVMLPDGQRAPAGTIVVVEERAAPRRARAAGTDEAPISPLRVLTDARGAFEVKVPRTGRYGFRALRIGFEPSAEVIVDVGTAGVDTIASVGMHGVDMIELRLSATPVNLTRITVRARDECRVNPDSGLMVSRVWQEARKALVSSQLNESAALSVDWVVFERSLDSAGSTVKAQSLTARSERTSRAFRSAPVGLLASQGFVIADGDVLEFFAPDAAVLLSEEFARGHCLALRSGTDDHAHLIGVAFLPTHEREGVRDIRGTFWLDRATAELRSLDFSYTNLPRETESVNAGGRVEYARLTPGHWIVNSWTIRMPVVEAEALTSTDPTRRVYRRASRMSVSGVNEVGGVVTRVMAGDAELLRAELPALEIRVTGGASRPSARTTVTLAGSNVTALTDSAGIARFGQLLAGRYRARVSTPLMDSLRVAPVERAVVVAERGVTRASLAIPGDDQLARAVCGAELSSGAGLLRGSVRDSLGVAVNSVAVTVSWIAAARAGSGQGASRGAISGFSATRRALGTFSDSTGTWRVCGVPREVPLTVWAASDVHQGELRVELSDTSSIGVADIPMSPVERATRREEPVSPLGVVLEVSVTSSQRAPLAGARIAILADGGRRLEARTDESGRAIFPDLKPGQVTLDVRRVGFAPGRLVLTVAEGRNTAPVILDAVRLPVLDTMRVIGSKGASTRLDAFESRRARRESSASITAAEIERRKPHSAWQLLATVPSVRLMEGPSGVGALSSRVTVKDLRDAKVTPCWMRVAIDGVLLPGEPPNLAELPPPADIHGIEVFGGPSMIPPEYAGLGSSKWCGLIAVWTKR